MDNKVQKIVLKSFSALIIFLGILFTVWVMGDDNPKEMSYEQQEQWAIKEAIDKELNKTMTSAELNAYKAKRTTEIANEKEKTLWNDVSLVIDYSIWLLYFAVILILGAFVYLAVIDTKKTLKILAGIAAFVLLMILVYFTASSEVPVDLVESEKGVLDVNKIHTPGNWKMASAAISATGILIITALLGWLGGSLVKVFR